MTRSIATSRRKAKDPKRYEKVIPRPLKCIRCGVCCILVPCGAGKVSDETGLCSYLTVYEEGYTSCRYIEENGNLFGGGCFLRRNDEVYKLHREEAENRIGIKLVGIKEGKKSGKNERERSAS